MRTLEQVEEMATKVKAAINQLKESGDPDTGALEVIDETLSWVIDETADDARVEEYLP